jgi:hypothetical protein
MKKRRNIRLQCKVDIDATDYVAATWYSDATKLIQDLYGDNWRLFVNILAATSPRQSVKRNWRQTAAIVAAYIDRDQNPNKFANLLADCMPAHLNNIIRALQNRPIKGPKVRRFANNLLGDLSDVTIDTWICKAYGIDQNKLTEKQYKRLEKKIQLDAKQKGMSAANWQAVLWYAIRRMSGKRPKSFVSVYRSISMETPCFSFMYGD